ncbi:MAG: FtsX-like permease family protein, partial [Acidimicrobiales bacterium]
TVVLLLVGLVAAAGFVVVAQRRSRQLGMLAATGADDRHLRLAVLAHGAAVGLVAGVVGGVVGLLGWTAVAPRVETAANHRIQRFDLPWPMIAATLALALLTAMAAAWWPARAVSRAPVTEALSGRPPTPRPARRSAIVATGCIVAGTAGLVFGLDTVHDEANPLLVLPSIPLLVIGLLLISPLAVGALAASGSRLPVAPRLALRDLSRYRARSGTALAAISLSLGLAMAIVLAATAAQAGTTEGNLSDRQILFRLGGGEPFVPVRSPEEVAALEEAVARFAATLDESRVLALEAVADPAVETFEGHDQHPVATLAWPVNEHTNRDIDPLYVATPELARRLGIDLAAVPRDTDVLTGSDRSELFIVNVADPALRDDPAQALRIPAPAYSSVPAALMTAAAMERDGLVAVPSGWLVDATDPLTDAQRDAARRVAADAGLTAEIRDEQGGLGTLRQSATATGALFALGVLAMTVGLIRSESGQDLHTLTAAGATSTTRRTLTAATAGGLALLGALLGTASAYLALGAGYSHELGELTPMPVPEIIAVLIGLPLLATASGWLLAGREPDALGRAAID